jgi:hypothetical protein
VDYRRCRIKQYHKEGQALRTETTINDTRDFGVGHALKNLPRLRQIGFTANRRLLDVQTISQDCALGQSAFDQLNRPVEVHDQRAAGLRYADARVQALFSALLGFSLLPDGFRRADLQERVAPLLGHRPADWKPGRVTYDLRRLRLHGLLERKRRSHRYQLTPLGMRSMLFYTRTYARVLRSGLAQVLPPEWSNCGPLRRSFDETLNAIDAFIADAKLAA